MFSYINPLTERIPHVVQNYSLLLLEQITTLIYKYNLHIIVENKKIT